MKLFHLHSPVTVTVKEHTAEWPNGSTAVYVTVVVWMRKVKPGI